jgi:hypothetical protein
MRRRRRVRTCREGGVADAGLDSGRVLKAGFRSMPDISNLTQGQKLEL